MDERLDAEGDNMDGVDNGGDRKQDKAGSLSPATGRHDVDAHGDSQMSNY